MIDGPLFKIGSLAFYPYGLCMGLGIIGCFLFLLFTLTKKNFNDEAIEKLLILGIFATAFGVFMAMVFQALYDYIENPSAGFSLSGSMTFQGGLIGGVVSFLTVWNLYIFAIAPYAKHKIFQNHMNASLSDSLPFIPIAITIAHAFGRLGCTFAGCCHGAQTDKWYGIWMYNTSYGHGPFKVVPTQLFECIFLIVLGGIMALLYFKFKFRKNFSVYAIGYGIWRFIIEFVRDDHRGDFIGVLTPSQFWSIIMVIVGIGYIFLDMFLLAKLAKHPELQPPVRLPKNKKAVAATPDGAPVDENGMYVVEERIVPNDNKPTDTPADGDSVDNADTAGDTSADAEQPAQPDTPAAIDKPADKDDKEE